MYIGQKIRKLRRENNFSAKELGAQIGVTEGAIYAYEKGVSDVSLDKVKQLATVFEINYQDLLENSIINEEKPKETDGLFQKMYNKLESELDFLKTQLTQKDEQIKSLFDLLGKLTGNPTEPFLLSLYPELEGINAQGESSVTLYANVA